MSSLFARLERDLHVLSNSNQWRTTTKPHGLDFCSNDYLSLSRHPHIIQCAKRTLDNDGYGSSSSRFIRGERTCYQTLEQRLSRFKQCERALLFSSGYLANIGVLSTLIKKGDLVLSDQLNHASIIDGLRLSGADIRIFGHNNVDEVFDILKNASKPTQKFPVTESLFSMDGDFAPLDRYADMAQKFDVALIVDEAHSVGLYGTSGSGLIDHFGIANEVMLSINGLGKAFGCYGAFVAGTNIVIDYLFQKSRTLIYTTALPPLAISAIDAALDLVEQGDDLREKLFQNVSLLRGKLFPYFAIHNQGLLSPIIPIIIGNNQQAMIAAAQLQQAGFDVKAIRPPSVPENKARLRITTNVSHCESSLESIAHKLRSFL